MSEDRTWDELREEHEAQKSVEAVPPGRIIVEHMIGLMRIYESLARCVELRKTSRVVQEIGTVYEIVLITADTDGTEKELLLASSVQPLRLKDELDRAVEDRGWSYEPVPGGMPGHLGESRKVPQERPGENPRVLWRARP